nr:PKD domain-containing protein [uncultured Methanolobus sp.]
MDRRLFLPIVIMFLSVLLLGGLINYQTGYAQESPESGVSAPVIGEKETVVQDSPKASVQEPEELSSNTTKEEAPASTPTFMGMGGGFSSPKVASSETETPEKVIAAEDVIVVADFGYEVDGLNVTFTDKSQNASTWFWDFGDNTNSTEQNPVHEYESVNVYTVTLTAYDKDVLNNASTEQNVDLTSKTVEEGNEEEEEEENKEEGGSEETTPVTQEVPEFPTIAIPMVAIVGMAFIFSRRQ